MKLVRWLLGRLILLGELIFSPRPPQRSDAAQAAMDEQTRNLVLYQYKACPFCVKVRFTTKRHGLNVETRDPRQAPDYHRELLDGGGKLKVPCLRIDTEDENVQWLYESSEIVKYLDARFGTAA